MSFELQIALQRILAPSLIAFTGALAMSRCDRNGGVTSELQMRGAYWPGLFGATLIAVALIVSDLWQRDLLANPTAWRQWNAREPWMWMVWMIPAAMVLLSIVKAVGCTSSRFASWSWPATVAIATGVLWVALPQGKGYEDKLRDAVSWIAMGTVAAIWNASAINGIASRPGGRWSVFVLLAQLGCVAGLVLQSYASLGEWVLAGVGTTLGVSIASLLTPSGTDMQGRTSDFGWPLAPAVIGLTVLGVVCVAVSTFYVSNPQPLWLVASVLLLPSGVGVIDAGIRNWSPWWRVAVAASISALVLGAVIVRAANNQPAW